jgi:hypothetical protein
MAGAALALGDLPEVEGADERLAAARSAATTPAELKSVAKALIAHRRWDAAGQALNRALKGEPECLELAFGKAELQLAAGDMQAARSTLADALARVSSGSGRPGDPGWICRLLWQLDGRARQEAIDVVAEEYSKAGFSNELTIGLIEGTPTSPRQTGRDHAKMAAWCSDWGHHEFIHRGIGIVQTLNDRPTTALQATRGPSS